MPWCSASSHCCVQTRGNRASRPLWQLSIMVLVRRCESGYLKWSSGATAFAHFSRQKPRLHDCVVTLPLAPTDLTAPIRGFSACCGSVTKSRSRDRSAQDQASSSTARVGPLSRRGHSRRGLCPRWRLRQRTHQVRQAHLAASHQGPVSGARGYAWSVCRDQRVSEGCEPHAVK